MWHRTELKYIPTYNISVMCSQTEAYDPTATPTALVGFYFPSLLGLNLGKVEAH